MGQACSWCCQACLAGLLTRLGAGTDIVIGCPTAGRTDSTLDDLVGFFVNTLVLRTDTSGNPSVRELILRVRAGNLAAYSHQEVPFERLVEALNPPRSLSHHPLFQVMLAFQNNAQARFEVPGLASQFEPVAPASAKFDLLLSLSEERDGDGAPAGIVGAIEYATDLFERESVEALVQRFLRLLEGAVASPERALGSLYILSAAEREHHPARLERHRADTGGGDDSSVTVCGAGGHAAPMPLRSCSRTSGSPMESLKRAPTGWRIICAGVGLGPRWWWGCAWSARLRW